MSFAINDCSDTSDVHMAPPLEPCWSAGEVRAATANLLHFSVCQGVFHAPSYLFIAGCIGFLVLCVWAGEASLHLRRHDEAEARWRAGSFARRQVGDLQRGRGQSRSEYQNSAC